MRCLRICFSQEALTTCYTSSPASEFSELRKLARNLPSVQWIRLIIQTLSIVTPITWQYEHFGPRSIFIFQCGARTETVGHPWSGNPTKINLALLHVYIYIYSIEVQIISLRSFNISKDLTWMIASYCDSCTQVPTGHRWLISSLVPGPSQNRNRIRRFYWNIYCSKIVIS
jgi:hypothetical protein